MPMSSSRASYRKFDKHILTHCPIYIYTYTIYLDAYSSSNIYIYVYYIPYSSSNIYIYVYYISIHFNSLDVKLIAYCGF